MNSLIERLLKPLPPDRQMVSQMLHPLYDSRVLATFFNGKLEIVREVNTGSRKKLLIWEKMPVLRPLKHQINSTRALVSAMPRNDPLRRLPSNASLGSVWMLMAYLCELGPVDAPIAAVATILINRDAYVGYWGVVPQFGKKLFLIREHTQHAFLRKTVNAALMLIEQPAP